MNPLPRQFQATVDTQRLTVVVLGGSKPTQGRTLTFRPAETGAQWTIGRVKQVGPDGHLRIDSKL